MKTFTLPEFNVPVGVETMEKQSNVDLWKQAVCETRDALENGSDAHHQENLEAYLGALECLCAAYEKERSAP